MCATRSRAAAGPSGSSRPSRRSRVVKLRVPGRELGFHLEDGTYVVEPGRFDIWVGASALADLASGFEIIDGLRLSPGQREATRIQLVK
jgi:beta-glucosidase